MVNFQKPQVSRNYFLINLEGTQTPEIRKGEMERTIKANKRSVSHTLNTLDPFGSLKNCIPEDPEYGKDSNQKDEFKIDMKSQPHLVMNKPKTVQNNRKKLKFLKQKVDYLK
jgi:hypothetical protein